MMNLPKYASRSPRISQYLYLILEFLHRILNLLLRRILNPLLTPHLQLHLLPLHREAVPARQWALL